MFEGRQTKSDVKSLQFGIILAVIGIIFLTIISLSVDSKSDSVSITVLPEVPREGMPLLVTFNLNNPSLMVENVDYELYANGALLTKGTTLLPMASTKQFSYVHHESPGLGERINFHLKTKTRSGFYEKTLSVPAYPPQVWSSFVSFATFSTSIMSSSMSSSMGTSISSMQFYNTSFMNDTTLNIGLIFSMVLIVLLVFLELTEPLELKGFKIASLRVRFSRLSVILFTVFVGMVFTKVVMILG
jgi:hypothetical protein